MVRFCNIPLWFDDHTTTPLSCYTSLSSIHNNICDYMTANDKMYHNVWNQCLCNPTITFTNRYIIMRILITTNQDDNIYNLTSLTIISSTILHMVRLILYIIGSYTIKVYKYTINTHETIQMYITFKLSLNGNAFKVHWFVIMKSHYTFDPLQHVIDHSKLWD